MLRLPNFDSILVRIVVLVSNYSTLVNDKIRNFIDLSLQ